MFILLFADGGRVSGRPGCYVGRDVLCSQGRQLGVVGYESLKGGLYEFSGKINR